MQIGLGNAHAKVILIGEHSVVYGHQAIAIPLTELKITTTVSSNNSTDILLDDNFYNGEANLTSISLKNKAESVLISAIVETLTYLDKPLSGLTIKTNTMIPIQRGLGSSAAISVATIRAIFDYYKTPLSETVLRQLANETEVIAHKTPSGLDVLVCAHNDSIVFSKDQPYQSINVDLDAYLVIADTKIKGNTKDAVLQVKQHLANPQVKVAIDNLGELASKSLIAIENKNSQELGKYLTLAHHNLQILGVSCPELDNLVEIALNANAYGAKLTGSGLGGNMIALVKTKAEANTLAIKLKSTGVEQVWIQKI